MRLLYGLALCFLVIGLAATLFPELPGAGFLRLGIVLAVIVAIVEVMTGRRS